jgi:hypothetical protein
MVQLAAVGLPPVVTLRPEDDWPDTANVAVDLARVAAVVDRVAADVGELARARPVRELESAAVRPDRRSEQRRRLAEPDLDFAAFCRGETDAHLRPEAPRTGPGCVAGRQTPPRRTDRPPIYADNPHRPR